MKRRRIVDARRALDAVVRHRRIDLRQVDALGNWCRNAGPTSTSVLRSQMILRPITMTEVVRTTSEADWRPQRWNALADTRSWYDTCTSLVQAARVANWNTIVRQWRSLSGNCESEAAQVHSGRQMRQRKTRLDSDAAGLFAFTLESEMVTGSGSRLWLRRLRSQEG